MAKSTKKSDREAARNLWLAGIGVYGKAMGEATSAAMRMSEDANKMFEDLVQKRQALEDIAVETGKNIIDPMGLRNLSAFDVAGDIDNRIKKMRQAFGLPSSYEDRIQELESEIKRLQDELTNLEGKKTKNLKKKSRK